VFLPAPLRTFRGGGGGGEAIGEGHFTTLAMILVNQPSFVSAEARGEVYGVNID